LPHLLHVRAGHGTLHMPRMKSDFPHRGHPSKNEPIPPPKSQITAKPPTIAPPQGPNMSTSVGPPQTTSNMESRPSTMKRFPRV